MRIKATTTGLQAAERYRGREREGSREEATLQGTKKMKTKKPHCAPADFLPVAGTDRNRLRYLTLYNSATFSHLDQLRIRRKKELVNGAACMGVRVPRSWSLCISHTHTFSTMHTRELCELKSSVMSQTLSLW